MGSTAPAAPRTMIVIYSDPRTIDGFLVFPKTSQKPRERGFFCPLRCFLDLCNRRKVYGTKMTLRLSCSRVSYLDHIRYRTASAAWDPTRAFVRNVISPAGVPNLAAMDRPREEEMADAGIGFWIPRSLHRHGILLRVVRKAKARSLMGEVDRRRCLWNISKSMASSTHVTDRVVLHLREEAIWGTGASSCHRKLCKG